MIHEHEGLLSEVKSLVRKGVEVDLLIKTKGKHSILFDLVTTKKPVFNDAVKRQIEAGYDPMGYSLDDYKVAQDEEIPSIFYVRWHCDSTCG